MSVKVLVKESGWGMQAALLPESLLLGRLRGGSPSPGYPSLEPELGVGSRQEGLLPAHSLGARVRVRARRYGNGAAERR